MPSQYAIGVLVFLALLLAPVTAIRADQDDTDLAIQNATGCLQKNSATHIYTLTDENGKSWDLRSKGVQLDSHVGHTVTVTGTIPKESEGSGDTSPQNHLLVTKLEMVRDTCAQP